MRAIRQSSPEQVSLPVAGLYVVVSATYGTPGTTSNHFPMHSPQQIGLPIDLLHATFATGVDDGIWNLIMTVSWVDELSLICNREIYVARLEGLHKSL